MYITPSFIELRKCQCENENKKYIYPLIISKMNSVPYPHDFECGCLCLMVLLKTDLISGSKLTLHPSVAPRQQKRRTQSTPLQKKIFRKGAGT